MVVKFVNHKKGFIFSIITLILLLLLMSFFSLLAKNSITNNNLLLNHLKDLSNYEYQLDINEIFQEASDINYLGLNSNNQLIDFYSNIGTAGNIDYVSRFTAIKNFINSSYYLKKHKSPISSYDDSFIIGFLNHSAKSDSYLTLFTSNKSIYSINASIKLNHSLSILSSLDPAFSGTIDDSKLNILIYDSAGELIKTISDYYSETTLNEPYYLLFEDLSEISVTFGKIDGVDRRLEIVSNFLNAYIYNLSVVYN